MNQIVGSVARRILAAAGGVLIAAGLSPEAVAEWSKSSEGILIGLILFALSQGWSIVEKIRR